MSTEIHSADDELLRVYLTGDEMWRMYIPLEEISPVLKQAVLSYEDKHFYRHLGVNPFSIARAGIVNIKAGEIEQGGSTISMQLARMIESRPRTFRSKFIELFRTLQLELMYSKDQIFERYLNLAPYGGNIVGVSAASYVYFGKAASDLSIAESALLAAIPNNPNYRRPDLHPDAAVRARNYILDLLEKESHISADTRSLAYSEPIPTQRRPLPFRAPHFAEMLRSNYPGETLVESSLDLKVQTSLEKLIRSYVEPMNSEGVSNASLIVIDNKSMKVKAWIGSLDFFNFEAEGQNDGVLAKRSPGSTLKPFVYGLALDKGLAGPGSLLEDVPVDYNGYQPINFDASFSGLVSFESALTNSLNVPAVNLDAALGNDGLHQFMMSAKVKSIEADPSHYGLSLVLGGGEIALADLTTLYAGLANGGKFSSYQVLNLDDTPRKKKLLSEQSSFILAETLAEVSRPNMAAVWEWSQDTPKIAWKTGTSYGHKDAWSIGFNQDYTIGVWVGNFDGTGSPALVGAKSAAPILMAAFDHLGSESSWFETPKDLPERKICSISGKVAGDNCASVKRVHFIPGKTNSEPCDVHTSVEIDENTGRRVCSKCRAGLRTSKRVFEKWPAKVATFLSRHDHLIESMPEHLESCTELLAGEAPIIRSPQAGSVFKTNGDVPLKYQKISLKASVSNETNKIFWFVDQELVHSGSPEEQVFVEPKLGRHVLTILDDAGRSTSTEYLVEDGDALELK